MKVHILKSFFLDGTQYRKGSIADVTNNLAHGLYEARLALPCIETKELEEPKRDKMMTKKRKKLTTKTV